MNKHLQPYVSRKLGHALELAASRPSRHEGIYSAYQESLQWLEDIDNLPPGLVQVLEKLGRGQGALPDRPDAEVRKRIATMSRAEVRALIDSLEIEHQRIRGQSAVIDA